MPAYNQKTNLGVLVFVDPVAKTEKSELLASIKNFEHVFSFLKGAPQILAVQEESGISDSDLGEGWQTCQCNEHDALIAMLQKAMRSLPLVDAFFLVPHSTKITPSSALLAQLRDHYYTNRKKLTRIIVPYQDRKPLWPWLVDIGFRPVFMMLQPQESLEIILEREASQVAKFEIASTE